MTRRRAAGFSLIELLIVVVIIGIVAAIAVPNLLDSRRSANGASAVEATRLFHSTEVTYQAGVGNSSFGSATNLFEQDFIDGVLAGAVGIDHRCKGNPNCARVDSAGGGRAFGYQFTLDVSEDHKHFSVVASPAAPGRSGDPTIYTDDTLGVDEVRVTCPPGKTYNPLTGLCEPEDRFLTQKALQAIRRIDAMTGGRGLPLATQFACEGKLAGSEAASSLVEPALRLFDANGDSLLTLEEVVGTDPLGVARRLFPTLSGRPQPGPGAGNSELKMILADFSQELRDDLALGIADEQPVGVPFRTMTGDVCGFLQQMVRSPISGR